MPTATMITNSPADTINWQAEQIRTRQYELVGHIWKVVLEASRGAAVPQASVAHTVGTCLDWYGYENVNGKNCLPRVAQSRDRSTLLLLDPVKRVDGKVGLPDIPDPTWRPKQPTAEELQTTVPLQKAPMIQQHLYEEEGGVPIGRARGQLKGTKYLVFGPVVQILVRPMVDNKLIDEGWFFQCGVDKTNGTHMEMLIHQDTGEAFFYGGQFQIYRPG
jgi:hypothetical protein